MALIYLHQFKCTIGLLLLLTLIFLSLDMKIVHFARFIESDYISISQMIYHRAIECLPNILLQRSFFFFLFIEQIYCILFFSCLLLPSFLA